MRYIIGTDEAGYGPNLGPLVVSGCCWSFEDESVDPDDILESAGIASSKVSNRKYGQLPLILADSKKLFTAKLEPLQRTIMVLLGFLHPDKRIDTWRELLELISVRKNDDPWEQGFDRELVIDRNDINSIRKAFSETLHDANIGFHELVSRIVSPKEFNRELERLDSKGTLLSRTTLGLIRRIVDRTLSKCVGDESFTVFCDKHGGRNRYSDILYEYFPDEWIEIVLESRELSHYRFNYGPHPIEFFFQAKGESRFATALASIASKYVRELSMIPFNEFWQSQVPGLKATAGYPEDAKRFRKEIEPVLKKLDIPECVLWRCK